MPSKRSEDIHTDNGRTVSCKLNHLPDFRLSNGKAEEAKKKKAHAL